MKSKKAKEFIENKTQTVVNGRVITEANFVRMDNVFEAVEIAENEMREKAIEALYEVCRYNIKGDCQSFIVGYDTPDDRLHEKCELAREYDLCKEKTRIKRFIELIDNYKKE